MGVAKMSNFLAVLLATFVTLPILAFIFTYIIGKKLTGRKKKSFHTAVNVSTLFFIFSVHFFITVIWEKSYFWLIVVSLLLIKILFTIGYWWKKQDINFFSIFRIFWRFNFLLFSTAYVFLIIYGIVTRITEVI